MQESPQIESLYNQMYAKNQAILMYRILDTLDKFIVMAILQNNFTQEETAMMVGISQEAVSKRLKKARELLRMDFADKVIF